MSPAKQKRRRALVTIWRWASLATFLWLMAAQCATPMPPLPTKPPPEATLRVAILTPMTGELATFGETVRNGITLAFDEWNERGGVNGQFIEWVLEDTRCDPLEARQAAERAIDVQGTHFIVGGLCSESAIPIARVADERGALFVATTATHPRVTVDETGKTRPLVFRASYPYPYQGSAAARFALGELATRRAAVLTDPGNDFVRSLVDEFSTSFVSGGGQVVAKLDYRSSEADFDSLVAEIARAAPEVLYVPDAYPVANLVGSSIQAQGLDVALIGSELWDNGALDLEALEGAFYTLHYSRDIPDAAAQAWQERYVSAFAMEPDTLAALGYDAANLLASAIEETDHLSPEDVAQTLEKMEFAGVTGRWSFDARHNPLKPVVVNRIEGEEGGFYGSVRP